MYREQEKTGKVPTLCTLREKLLQQPEPEARDLALAMELFTSGSLDIFAHETNVDTNNRIISYDIHDLGAQLKPAGLLTITDAMLNRVTLNWKRGKRTHIFVDEFHIVYENEYSGNFFTSAWRQLPCRRSVMLAVSLIGHGMALEAVWNGAPASYRGVPTSAAISKTALSRNSPVVSTAYSGSKIVGNGQTTAHSLHRA